MHQARYLRESCREPNMNKKTPAANPALEPRGEAQQPAPKPLGLEGEGTLVALLGLAFGIAVAVFVENPIWERLIEYLEQRVPFSIHVLLLPFLALIFVLRAIRARPNRNCSICQGQRLGAGLHCPSCEPQPIAPEAESA